LLANEHACQEEGAEMKDNRAIGLDTATQGFRRSENDMVHKNKKEKDKREIIRRIEKMKRKKCIENDSNNYFRTNFKYYKIKYLETDVIVDIS